MQTNQKQRVFKLSDEFHTYELRVTKTRNLHEEKIYIVKLYLIKTKD